MNILLVLCFLLTPAESLLVNEASSSNNEVETRPNRSKASGIKYVSLPSEQCGNIASEKPEEEACRDHCIGLKKGFFDGECVNRTCHCKFDVTAIVNPSAEKTQEKGKGKRRHGVKCKNLIRVKGQIGSENHKGCGIHCRLMSSDNKDGRCIEGVCQCSRDVIEETKDDDDDDEEQKDDGKCRSDDECEMECSGPSREARCITGICRCRILPPQQDPLDIPSIDREVKKCEHRRKAVSNEICRSHCEDFSKDHREGRCVDGICRCGYAVFEIMENGMEEEVYKRSPEDKILKKTWKSRGRSRGQQ